VTKATNGSSPGFTLLEVLVAILVFSLAAVAVVQIFAGGLRAISISEDQVAAVSRAQRLLDAALLDPDLGEGVHRDTTDDGYDVEISVQPVLEQRFSALPVRLEEIDLVLRWTRGLGERSYRISGMRWRSSQHR